MTDSDSGSSSRSSSAEFAPSPPHSGSSSSPPPPDLEPLHVRTGKPEVRVKKTRSCASCRLRRVACTRLSDQGVSGDCVQCARKGIVCVALPPLKKKTVQRGGKRIDQAKAEFGTRDFVLPALAPVGFSSTATRLLTNEIQGSLASELIQAYLSSASDEVLLIANTPFRAQFESAGRQLSNLDDSLQVLCSVIMAVSARNSDNPLLVGSGAPRSDQVYFLSLQGNDLSDYARARENACSSLLRQSLKLIDENGTLRSPNMESVASLILLESILDPDDLSLPSYTASYNTQIRQLLHSFPNPLNPRTASSAVSWTAYCRDAWHSAKTGMSPTFSEDDLLLMCDSDKRPPSLATVLSFPVASPASHLFWIFCFAFMLEATDVLNIIAARLTGVRARRSPQVDLEAIDDCLSRLSYSKSCISELIQRRDAYCISGITSPEQKEAIKHCNIVLVLRCAGAFSLDEIVLARLAEEQESATRFFENEVLERLGAKRGDEGEMFRQGVEVAREKTRALAFDAAMELASFLEGTLLSGRACAGYEWLDVMGIRIIFGDLKWVNYILETPTNEEGGVVPNFGYANKINALNWIHKALLSCSWSSATLASPAPSLKIEIDKLSERQTAYWHSVVEGLQATLVVEPQYGEPVLNGAAVWDDNLWTALGVQLEQSSALPPLLF